MAITFDSISGGELAEKFSIALAQIGRNIMDPNMEPEAVRQMTITLKFKPVEGGSIQVTHDVKTKLAGLTKSGTVFLIGQDARTGRIEISECRAGGSAAIGGYPAAVSRTPDMGVPYDPETGEIYGRAPGGGPIDLRKQA